MAHEPVSSRQHPIPPDHVEITLGDRVEIVAAADARILVEDIIDLPANGGDAQPP